MLDMSTLQVPEGFLQPDESLEAMLDPDILAADFGWVAGYRVVYERLQHNWAAYSPDLPGVISTHRSHRGILRMMAEAIPFHLRGLEEDRRERPWLYEKASVAS